MSLAKLVVHLQANYKGLTAGMAVARNEVAATVSHIVNVASQLDNVKEKLNDIAPEYALLSDLSRAFSDSTQLAGDQADFLRIKLRYISDTMDRLNAQTKRYEEQLTSAVASFQLKLLTDALRKQASATDQIRRLWGGNRAALIRYNQTASQTSQIHATMNQPKPMPQAPSPNRGLIKSPGGGGSAVSTALQVVGLMAQTKAARTMGTAMSAVRGTIQSVSSSIREVATATQSSVSMMDRFRLAALAPKTDPSLNVLKNGIEKVGDTAAAAVDKIRGVADATIEGIPDSIGQVAKSSAKMANELDKTSATMSKYISRGQIMSKGLTLLSTVFPFAAKAIAPLKQTVDSATAATERGAARVDAASAAMSAAANKARNAQFVLTGTFQKLGGTTDLYARGQYHAMLPARMLKREIEGSQRVVKAAMMVWNVAAAPVHKLALSVQRAREEFKVFRQTLPPLTGGLQLGVRAYRAFAHATYLGSSALRGVKAVISPVTWLGKQVWNLVRPAKAAKVGLDGVATGGQRAGIVLRGVSAAAGGTAAALTKVASAGAKMASSSAGSFLSAIPGKAILATTAVAGLALGMVGMGAKTAMATEKSNAVFGVMMKDMEQGKAVVSALQNSKAVGLFDNEEVLNSGRLLFKAGVAAADLQGKTEQLATIAAATSTELGDLTRIYQQGANSGSFQQDKINQLAERGIDIYHALTAATGASGAELKDMISGGKIGVAEMDAALAHLTEGQGIYAGSLDVLGNTTSGMMSTIKNNIMLALGSLMGAGIATGKPFLEMLVGWSESVKTHVGAVTPVLTQFTSMIASIFTGLYSVVASIWAAIFGVGQTTMAGMLNGVMEWVTKFKWFFTNIVPVAQFIWTQVALFAVMAFNDISYWITDKIPAYLTWFANNWQAVFRDIAMATVTVFTNLASNIKNAMTQIWEFIKSGGTAGLEFTWTPLLDGFQSTVEQLPDIPDRAMTALEASMQSQIETIGTNLADSYDAMAAEASAAMAAAAVVPEPVPLSTTPAAGSQNDPSVTGDAAAQENMKNQKKIAENKAAQSRSEEGQNIAAMFLKGLRGTDDKSVKKAQVDAAKHLEKLARDSDRAPRLIVETA